MVFLSHSSRADSSEEGSISSPRTSSTAWESTWLFGVQSNQFKKVKKTEVVDEKGHLCPGIQEAKVPLLKPRMKVVLNGSSKNETNVTYGEVRLPSSVRRARLIGRCQKMYISTAS